MPYDALVERNIAVPRGKVFAAFYDFGGLTRLVPDAVSSCECIGEGVGSQRSISLADGGTVVERMDVAHDEKVFAYSILENDAIPVDNYCAVITLEDTADAGDICRQSHCVLQALVESYRAILTCERVRLVENGNNPLSYTANNLELPAPQRLKNNGQIGFQIGELLLRRLDVAWIDLKRDTRVLTQILVNLQR